VGLAETPPVVTIRYRPRHWARPVHGSFLRWYALILHRRAGKTTAVINHMIRAATSDAWEAARLRHLSRGIPDADVRELLRVRHYAHVFPQLKQAKLSAWDMLKYYANFVVGARPNESELRVDFPCPSGHVRRVQLFGADYPDALRGPAFAGMCLDEFGQHPPGGFGEVLSKALADHLGFCVFAGTIKGKNQLYQTWKAAQRDPAWYTVWRNIDESLSREDGATIRMLRQALEDDRALIGKGLISQEEFDQEWYLNTESAIRGAYYGRQMAQVRKDGRITRVPFDPMLPVDTDWDIGVDDNTAIIFSQSLRSREVRLIDYYANSGEGIEHYIKVLRERSAECGYVYGQHWGPHDIEVREFGSGKTRRELAKGLGLHFEVTPKLAVSDGIDAGRLLLPRCWFDEERCQVLIEALTQYRKTWDEKFQQFTGPVRDWTTHPADAFRGLAVRHQPPKAKEAERHLPPLFMGRPTASLDWMH
jgi:phage terminase large subunit